MEIILINEKNNSLIKQKNLRILDLKYEIDRDNSYKYKKKTAISIWWITVFKLILLFRLLREQFYVLINFQSKFVHLLSLLNLDVF